MNYEDQLAQALAARDAAGTDSRARSRANRDIRNARMGLAREKGTHTEAMWFGLVAAFGSRCVMCAEILTTETLRKDHIVPIYQGGSDGIENIQPLCVRCNCAKGPDSFNWAEYRMEHGFDA